MPAITLKNIPETLYLEIKASANIHRRSLNSEILYCIERALGTHRLDVAEELDMARKIREKTACYVLSNNELNLAKIKGRP